VRGALLAAGVLGAALLDLHVALRPEPEPVTREDVAAAAAAVRAALQPGDVVIHSPLLPLAALAGLGDLQARPDLPAPAVRAARRVLAIDVAAAPVGGLGEPERVASLAGGLELRVHPPVRSDAAAPLFDLVAGLGPTTMRVERDGRAVRCDRARPEGGWDCPGEPEWLHAAPRVLRIGGADAECVWAHPTAGGSVILAIPGQPAAPPGRALVLRVAAGLTDDAVRGTPDGAPVSVALTQRGRSLAHLAVPNRVGWVRAEVDLEAGAGAELVVTAPRDGRRHHCVRAEVVEVSR
jgi:hypothetical protein